MASESQTVPKAKPGYLNRVFRAVAVVGSIYFWVVIPVVCLAVFITKGHPADWQMSVTLMTFTPDQGFWSWKETSGWWEYISDVLSTVGELIAFVAGFLFVREARRFGTTKVVKVLWGLLLCGICYAMVALLRENAQGGILSLLACLSGFYVGRERNRFFRG